MSLLVQRIVAFFTAFTAFISGYFGTGEYYQIPGFGAERISMECLYDEYDLPEFTYGVEKGCYESSDGTLIGKFTSADEFAFERYFELLLKNGFTVYDRNTIESNRFATLVNDNTAVYLSWYKNTRTIRIIAEPRHELCPLTDSTDGEYDTLLTSMQGETVVSWEGMGFIIRLCDGSFVIIDGGMGDPESVDSDKLMNILLSQKADTDEKPVIAAWIFTHMHGDHIGVFGCFSIDHHDDVVIQRMYFNFPKDEEILASDSSYMLDDTIYRGTQFRKCLTEYYPEVPVVKLHSGNHFAVRNAEFEVLYAYDDLYPTNIVDGGMNENSLLLKMTCEGQTVLWTGDLGPNSTELVMSEYHDELQSDILQMAHHGINGSALFYARVNPTYALLPASDSGYAALMLALPQNVALAANPNLRQIISTSAGTYTMRLPYEKEVPLSERIPTSKTVNPEYPILLND